MVSFVCYLFGTNGSYQYSDCESISSLDEVSFMS